MPGWGARRPLERSEKGQVASAVAQVLGRLATSYGARGPTVGRRSKSCNGGRRAGQSGGGKRRGSSARPGQARHPYHPLRLPILPQVLVFQTMRQGFKGGLGGRRGY